jgi:3-methylcrotonyl-CoA carboxylase alpha subunit
MPQFQLRLFDEDREFNVTRQGDRLHLTSGDFSADVRVLYQDAGEMLIEFTRPDGMRQRLRLAGARHGDKRQLWVDGRILTGERVRRRAGGKVELGSLVSSIPAVVSQILVRPGDAVSAGDKLILLESMKMVIPIQAPYDGRVGKILCAAGESVPAGVPLVEIEPL